MSVTAVDMALVLISMPPGTHQSSASAIVAGMETTVLNVSGLRESSINIKNTHTHTH